MTRNERKQVVIAGGGIGGLAAALACEQRGVPVRLIERAAQLSEVGAGIQIGPNVTRILQAWGLGEALAQVFKTIHAGHAGRMSLARVWRGALRDGMTLNAGRAFDDRQWRAATDSVKAIILRGIGVTGHA